MAQIRTCAKWPLRLAGLYLCWSMLVYFGTLRGDAHNWWPIFLGPLVWPLGSIEHDLLTPWLRNLLIPDIRAGSSSAWVLFDRLIGVWYIVGGTLWIWLVASVAAFGWKRLRGGVHSAG